MIHFIVYCGGRHNNHKTTVLDRMEDIKMQDINRIYNMLKWGNPPDTQLEGIKQARKITDLSLLIQPITNMTVWAPCARILFEKTDEELEPYLNELLEWLQDLNWVGATTIELRLKMFPGAKLEKPLKSAINKAKKMPNDDGLKWLYGLSGLIENDELRTCLSEEDTLLLKKYYNGID